VSTGVHWERSLHACDVCGFVHWSGAESGDVQTLTVSDALLDRRHVL
jgi:hypothetical protein